MPAERALDEKQFGSRTIRQRHRSHRQMLGLVGLKRHHQVVRQRGERVRERLAGMTGRIEIESLHNIFEPRSQHRHVGRWRRHGGAGPQSGVDRQLFHLAHLSLAQRNDDEIDQDASMDIRNEIRFDDQRSGAAIVEPFECCLDRLSGEHRLCRGLRNAKRIELLVLARPPFVADLRQIAI